PQQTQLRAGGRRGSKLGFCGVELDDGGADPLVELRIHFGSQDDLRSFSARHLERRSRQLILEECLGVELAGSVPAHQAEKMGQAERRRRRQELIESVRMPAAKYLDQR